MSEHDKDPAEAHREGLEEIEGKPHHPAAENAKGGAVPQHAPPPIIDPPGQKHRDGTLPNLKR
jgi:hypothetical protein